MTLNRMETMFAIFSEVDARVFLTTEKCMTVPGECKQSIKILFMILSQINGIIKFTLTIDGNFA